MCKFYVGTGGALNRKNLANRNRDRGFNRYTNFIDEETLGKSLSRTKKNAKPQSNIYNLVVQGLTKSNA